ncbi:MAG: transposase [Bdellovibrionales bacterium]|nr:transposase [Bdellovibrionales bacterium]
MLLRPAPPFGGKFGNIVIEQQIRPIAVGRHNWLVAGSNRGARSEACLFSLVRTYKLNVINTFA